MNEENRAAEEPRKVFACYNLPDHWDGRRGQHGFRTAQLRHHLRPVGTTIVDGSVQFPSDTNDFFVFQDLVPGTGFDLTASTTSTILEVDLLTSADAAPPRSANPYVFTSSIPNIVTGLTSPSDGQIVFDVITGDAEGPARAYTITVNTVTYAPEPGTLGAMGLGLAVGAVLTLRRQRVGDCAQQALP
jgi:hypothetical protein